MWVALSGTPGTGKTAVASVLKTLGFMVVPLHRFAQQNQCIAGVDVKRHSELIDMRKLEKAIRGQHDAESLVFFEGHIGHLLKSMEKVIVLRCHPQELEQRLLKKRWSAKKREENVEAELLDVILCEAVERHPVKDIFEIDTTKKTVEEIAAVVRGLVKKNFQPTRMYRVGRIDWSEEILRRYSS
jgi:adenylate kinase